MFKPDRNRSGKKIDVLDEAELATLLAHLKGHWLFMPTLLAAYTGMRHGEILGLRWRDIDFDKGTLQVAQTMELIGGKVCVTAPKTDRSSRTINLHASLLPELTEHRKDQAALRLPDIRGRALRLMLIRICLVMKTSLQPTG